MGKLIARGKGADDVTIPCTPGKTTTKGVNSKRVYVEDVLVHCDGDKNEFHTHLTTDPLTSCKPSHNTDLVATTTSVFVGGKAVGREGDTYLDVPCAKVVLSKVNQTSVFAG